MNKEFLKGIEAREKLHILKQVVKLDSLQLSLYKDSLVPSMQRGLDTAKLEIISLEKDLKETKKYIRFYQYLTVAMSIFSLGLLF